MKHCLTTFVLLLYMVFVPMFALADRDFQTFYQGDTHSNQIAITVDDLYEPYNLERILDICQDYGIKATFFTLGIVIKPEYGALWQRIVDEGHEIGNHTYSHPYITNMNSNQLQRQLRLTQEALNAVLDEPYTMRLFRPPFGIYDKRGYGSVMNLGGQGYPYLIMWSDELSGIQRSDTCIKGGDILLFHTNWQDIQCLEQLIPKLLAQGYKPVTVSELLGLPPMKE